MRNILILLSFYLFILSGCSSKDKGETRDTATPTQQPVRQQAPAPMKVQKNVKPKVVPSPEEKRVQRLMDFMDRLSSQTKDGVKKLLDRMKRVRKGEQADFRDLQELLNIMERGLFDLIRSNPDLTREYRDHLENMGLLLDVYATCIRLYSLPDDAPEHPKDNRWMRKLIMTYNDVARSNNGLKGVKTFMDKKEVPKDPMDPSTYALNFAKAWKTMTARARKWAAEHPLVKPDATVVPEWMRQPRKHKVRALFMKHDFLAQMKWLKSLRCRPHRGEAPKGAPSCKDVASRLPDAERALRRFAEGWLDVVQEIIDIEPQIPSAMNEKLDPLLKELNDLSLEWKISQ